MDIDFSTPIIYALKHNKIQIAKILLKNDKTCLKQSSMKYGTALHVALSNKHFKNALRILRILKKSNEFNL